MMKLKIGPVMAMTVALLALLLGAVSAEEDGAFTCPKESGYYEHENCWQYWQCGNWIAFERTCANGTQWQQNILTCNHATDCKRPVEPVPEPEPTEGPTTEASPTDGPSQAPEPEPTQGTPAFVCPAYSGYWAHENCWQFWQCDHWIAHEMTCGNRTQWDQSILTCNHLTDCQRPDGDDGETDPITSPVPEENPTTPEDVDATTPAKEVSSTPAADASTPAYPTPSPDFKCPDQSGYYPHEICWKFWQCSNGNAYAMDCAPGTQWNQTLLTCVHLTAECDRPASPTTPAPVDTTTPIGNDPTTPAKEDPTTPKEDDVPTTPANEDPTTPKDDDVPTTPKDEDVPTTPKDDGVPTTQAPVDTTASEDDGETTPGSDAGFKCPDRSGYYPHEICWKFWQCSNWNAYEMDCAPATQWNQTLLTCVHLTANCDRPASPTTTPVQDSTTPVAVDPTTPEDVQTTPKDDEVPTTPKDDDVPTTPKEDVPTTPKEDDVPTTPNGDGDVPTTQAPVDSTTAEQDDGTTPDSDDDATSAKPSPAPGFKCPDRSGYYPHEICWKFWQCSNWNAYAMDCAPATQWNQTLLTCVHLTANCDRPASPTTPDSVDISSPVQNDPTTPEDVQTTPKDDEVPTTPKDDDVPTTPNGDGDVPTTQAPADSTTAEENDETTPDSDDGATSAKPSPAPGFKCPDRSGYYPHEICWKFWQCSNWNAYEMDCAPATQWNQTLLTCVHLTANCDRPASPTTTPVQDSTTPVAVDPTTPEDVQTTPKDDEVPTTPKDDDVPTTPKEDAVPTTPKDDDVPTTPNGDGDVPTTQAPVDSTTAEEDDETTPDSDDGATSAKPSPAPGFKCPDRFGYYPHEICWKFWQCSNWDAYEMDCAPGTQWNQTILTCDHLTANCDRPASPPTTPAQDSTTPVAVDPTTLEPETDAPTTTTTEAPTTTEDPATTEAETDAPTTPTEAPTTTAVPTTTTTEAPTTTEDPATTEAETDAPTTTQEPTTTTTEAPTTTEEPTTTTTEAPTTTQAPTTPTKAPTTTQKPTTAAPTTTAAPNFRCPVRNGYFPHKDCWKFWQCGNYIAYEQTCWPYTQWDQSILTCDYQSTCRRPDSPWPPVRPTGNPVTVPPTTPAPKPTTTQAPAATFKCPTAGGYFAHATCWKFWQCGNWIAYEMTCGPYTQWDQRIKTCRHATSCKRSGLFGLV